MISISDAFFLLLFFPFVYGYPSSCPRAHCTPNKSVPTLRYTLLSCCLTSTEARWPIRDGVRYTRRHGHIYTGPCPKALTECSPLDFRRSSIIEWPPVRIGLLCISSWLVERASGRVVCEEVLAGTEIPGGGGKGKLYLTLHCSH